MWWRRQTITGALKAMLAGETALQSTSAKIKCYIERSKEGTSSMRDVDDVEKGHHSEVIRLDRHGILMGTPRWR